MAGSWLGVAIDPEYLEARPGDVRDSIADIGLASDIIGYTPETTLAEGLGQTIEAMRR